MHEISAAILAGGRALRFGGADKASLLVGGSRIIERQLATLSTVADDIRIVSNHPDRYGELGVRVIPDRIPDAGPLGGIHAALVDAVHDAVIVMACDLPFVPPALLEALVKTFESAGEVDAVVPRSARGLEPLCALYTARCAELARQRIEQGDLAVRGLLEEVNYAELRTEVLAACGGETVFLNINTPHDHQRARGEVELNEKPFKDRITE